jgi:hypothetical protein
MDPSNRRYIRLHRHIQMHMQSGRGFRLRRRARVGTRQETAVSIPPAAFVPSGTSGGRPYAGNRTPGNRDSPHYRDCPGLLHGMIATSLPITGKGPGWGGSGSPCEPPSSRRQGGVRAGNSRNVPAHFRARERLLRCRGAGTLASSAGGNKVAKPNARLSGVGGVLRHLILGPLGAAEQRRSVRGFGRALSSCDALAICRACTRRSRAQGYRRLGSCADRRAGRAAQGYRYESTR